LRPTGAASADDVDDIVRTLQAQVFPLDATTSAPVRGCGTRWVLWRDTTDSLTGAGNRALAARQAAGMVAHARWMYRAALARDDHPGIRPWWQRRILVDGLDDVRTESLPPQRSPDGAERRVADRSTLSEVSA
jgi:hypothetical protein